MAPRLLLAFDDSPAATTAIRATAEIFPGAQLLVTTVPPVVELRAETVGVAAGTLPSALVQETIDEIAREGQEQALAMAQAGVDRARADGLDAEVAPAPAQAPAWSALLDLAHELGVDLIACGTRGRSGFARALLGSTSSSLLHNADLPVLVVPDGAGTLTGPAVLAYDGSEPAKRAIAVAGRLLQGRPIVVVHVWESQFRHTLTARSLSHGPVDELRKIVDVLDRALADNASAIVEEGVQAAQAVGLEATGQALESDAGVWRVLSTAARTHDAAIVIAGSRGLGSTRAALLGSVSAGLAHNAELPVLIVPSSA
jgi:nucleotide-binding universal stress UspA family protein